jgi:Ca2+-transporting ATPase
MNIKEILNIGKKAPFRSKSKYSYGIKRVWKILFLTSKKFLHIDGLQWAGAYSFNLFFSLFPLIVLFVTVASIFIDKGRAGKEIITYIENYVPISGEMHNYVFDTIAGVIKAREKAGAVAFIILVWASLQCFITLVVATNRAWGITLDKSWWRLPLRSLVLFGTTASMVLLGMVFPVVIRIAKNWFFTDNEFSSWLYYTGSFFIPLLMAFLSLSVFYILAPLRSTRFAVVWVAALFTTILLQASESLFELYLKNFATLNAVYGTFGGIMALLLWIYLCGCIFIFGACLCAAQAEMSPLPMKNSSSVDKI